QKFFDMHESSRLNMSFKCSGAFNIIYIMRTNVVSDRIQRFTVVIALVADDLGKFLLQRRYQ
ncbi:hypothetical protein DUP94_19985, partial [Salmonella enterica subsp. enterica serovar Rubislaw]|nr:hypothetical protein [Salmonella enterica subsp. enterica serovar Rubislaw]